MSGGSYDYFYFKMEEFADAVLARSPDNPKRVAFAKLLKTAAKAAHDIEWVDSGDYSKDGDVKALDAVFEALKVKPHEVYKGEAFDRIKALVDSVRREA